MRRLNRALPLLLLATGCNDFVVGGGAPGFFGGAPAGPPVNPEGRPAFEPSLVNFGTVDVGRAAYANVVITNVGEQPLFVQGVGLDPNCTYEGRNDPCPVFVTSAPDADVALDVGEDTVVQLAFVPTRTGELSGAVLHVLTTSATVPLRDVPISGRSDGPPECDARVARVNGQSASLDIDPGDEVELVVESDVDVTADAALLTQPAFATATLAPVDATSFLIAAVAAGHYEVELTATDEIGRVCRRVEGFDAIPEERVFVELAWQGEVDLDLHVVDEESGAVRATAGAVRGPAHDDFAGLEQGSFIVRAHSNSDDDTIASVRVYVSGLLRTTLLFPVPPHVDADPAIVRLGADDVCVEDLTDGDDVDDCG